MQRRFRIFSQILFVLAAVGIGVAQTPVSPYVALVFPETDGIKLHAAPVKSIQVGPLAVVLETTILGAVSQRFGGTMHNAGDAGDAVNWLCYAGNNAAQKPVVYWFASNNEMSSEDHSISQVAVQSNPGGVAPAGCGSAAVLATIDLGVPGVGTSLADVTKRLGAGKPDAKGFLSYQNERHVAGRGDKDSVTLQTVQYQIAGGVVVTVSVSQVTSD
jgi:hypothetical protein